MKIKKLYISKFFIKCLFLIVLFFVVGCSNKSEEIYNNAIQKGLDNLASENYDKAIVSFEFALEEKAGDKRAKNLKSQTEYFDTALKSFESGDLEKTSENVERVKKIKHGSEALVKKSNDIIEEIKVITTTKKSFQNQYNDADILFKDNDYSDSLEKITTLLQEDLINQTYYVSIKKSSQELEESINEEIGKLAFAEEVVEADKRVEQSSIDADYLDQPDHDENVDQVRIQAEQWLTEAEASINSGDQTIAWNILIRGGIGVERNDMYPDLEKRAYDLAYQLDGHEMYIDLIEEWYGK